jgi:ribosomal protein S18 acetylase RimI-like enzyme
MNETTVHVRYLELTRPPPPIQLHRGDERILRERLPVGEYLDLYRCMGGPLRWDQRLNMPRPELTRLLESEHSRIYILRDGHDRAIGLCEFEHCLPDIELKNFGLIATARGKALGSWLLRTALHHEWKLQPKRIWLHTDNWDHPAALRLYENAGFRTYRVQDEPPGNL